MNRNNIPKSLFLILLGMLLAFGPVFSQDATEIMRKVDQKMRGKTSQGETSIEIVRPTWSREMGVKTWSLGTDYSLILLTAPQKDKGTVFLKRGKEVWNWVPSIERSIKLPPSMMMQSWMGTDFTNDDLVRESSIVRDYEHKLVKDTVLRKHKAWVIELIPKPDAPVVWGKILTYVDQEHYVQLSSKFYDEDGYLVNIMEAYDLKPMSGKVIATRMEMIPVEDPGHKTVMKTKSIIFDKPIPENFFTTQNMKRVR